MSRLESTPVELYNYNYNYNAQQRCEPGEHRRRLRRLLGDFRERVCLQSFPG